MAMITASLGCSLVVKAPQLEKMSSPIGNSNNESEQQTTKNSEVEQRDDIIHWEEKADLMMEAFVTAINNRDEKVIAELVEAEKRLHFGLESIKPGLDNYNEYFKGEAISKFERNGQAPYMHDTFLYLLTTPKGINKEVIVNFQEKEIRIYDEVFEYSLLADRLLDRFLKSIQTRDANMLASTLNPDDLPYPVSDAEKVIINYEQKFDTSTIKYKFTSFDKNQNGFEFLLIGQKGNRSVEHEVYVVYGDSLVGLHDAWVPGRELKRS